MRLIYSCVLLQAKFCYDSVTELAIERKQINTSNELENIGSIFHTS